MKYIIDRQPYWSEPELDELEEKFKEKYTGDNDVDYSEMQVID